MSLVIERAKLADQDQIAWVLMEAFNAVDQGWTPKSSREWIKTYADYSCYFIAKVDDQIVGFIAAHKKANELFLDAIGVLPEFMGRGIGKALWQAAMDYCKDNNLAEIKMIADPKSTAYKWYKRLGFNQTGWVELQLKTKDLFS